MNSRFQILFAATVAASLFLSSQQARASLTLSVAVSSIYQLGDGSTAVSLGHTVLAGTNLNRLIAGGTFNASCASQYTGMITGERTLPSTLIAQYNRLAVTVPEQVPSVRNMPGFENVPPGSILQCTYRWTAQAEESTYTIGIPGYSITDGGEKRTLGDTVGFEMFKNAGGEEPSRGCMH